MSAARKAIPTQLAFDFAEGKRRRDAGTAQALSAALPWALAAERWLLRRRERFTSEEIVAAIGLPSGKVGKDPNNAVGALISDWSRRGAIRTVGYAASKRASSHGALLRVWLPTRQALRHSL